MAASSVDVDIVADIVKDLSDRRGLRHEWEQIDEEIRAEIVERWREIVRSHLTVDRGEFL